MTQPPQNTDAQQQQPPQRPSSTEEEENVKILGEDEIDAFEKRFHEVGHLAIWSVSSAKHGNGVLQLRDGDTKTCWQSDGSQPHIIEVQFSKLTAVSVIGLLLSFHADESYTPRKVVVRASTYGEMHDVGYVEVDSPQGWVCLFLHDDTSNAGDSRVYATRLTVYILENHQNGRDTHIRGMKVFGPRTVCAYSSIACESQSVLR